MPANHDPKTPAWPPRSAPRLFVEQTLEAGAQVLLEGNQAHYLNRVMRVRENDGVILCDNQTGEWAMRVATVEKRAIKGLVTDHLRPRESVPDFWLCPALLKKDRFDLVLEKVTELGVGEIRPFVARRSVADKLNLERAKIVTTEAAEQCARTALPKIHAPTKLETMLRDWPDGRALFFADEMGGQDAATTFTNLSGPAAILIGPEGGFDDAERALIRAHPAARAINLGPRILRGETAAIAATAVLMAVAGDWSAETA